MERLRWFRSVVIWGFGVRSFVVYVVRVFLIVVGWLNVNMIMVCVSVVFWFFFIILEEMIELMMWLLKYIEVYIDFDVMLMIVCIVSFRFLMWVVVWLRCSGVFWYEDFEIVLLFLCCG